MKFFFHVLLLFFSLFLFIFVLIVMGNHRSADPVRGRGPHHGRRLHQPGGVLPHHDHGDPPVDALQGGRPYPRHRVGRVRRGMGSTAIKRFLAGTNVAKSPFYVDVIPMGNHRLRNASNIRL